MATSIQIEYSLVDVLMVVSCNKLFSSKLLEGLRYPIGRLHEDEFMINTILSRADKIVFIPDRMYLYRTNAESITSPSNMTNVKHLDAIDAYEERIKISLSDGRKAFAIQTLKSALLKISGYYNLGGEIATVCIERYKKIYHNYSYLLTTKQKVKYFSFLIVPNIFANKFKV